jgi:hypothetical protein
MPAKTTAPVNTSGFWEFLVLLFVLFTFLTLSSGASKNSPPVSLPQSTSKPSVQIAGTAAPVVEVFVTPINVNKYDNFDIRDAIVRVSNSSQADSGADGRLTVPCASGESMRVWAPGYAIATSEPCDGQKISFPVTLTHLEAIDNTNYLWSSAVSDCNNCHGSRFDLKNPTGPSFDEMNEWFRSGHAKVFDRGYFESMYRGTSVSGEPSIPAQPVIIDNEWVPVPPEKSAQYHGPGFSLDFPGQPGNCAYCHVPASIPTSLESMDLYYLFPRPAGSWGEGVTCDVCHKVFDVILADNKFPFPDRPGILSYRFLRPNSGIFMTGPFSNIFTVGLSTTTNHGSTCSPIFSQSEFCAPCHFGKFGDMVVYNSFGEWKASPYAANPLDPTYRTCQDCHMSHLYKGEGDSLSSERQACSANNTRFQNFDHNMMDFGPPGSQVQIPLMVKDAAHVGVTFGSTSPTSNTLDVNVTVTNTRAGHKFPTDSPLRHLILVVTAVDRVDTPLIQVSGDRIPNWAGPGPISPINIADNLMKAGILDYGGLPGKIFANLLVEEETNLSPGMAYWNETKYASVVSAGGANSDTRLIPWQPNTSTYSFAMPDAGDVKVTVNLFYRYAFYDLMVWKEWYDRPDILVTSVECKGPPKDMTKMLCQTVQTPTP